MKQPIAGVAPADLEEVTVMSVFPSIAAYPPGRILGRLYAIKTGFFVVTIGNLIALASIPVALLFYFLRLAPKLFGLPLPPHGGFYVLTNRRVVQYHNEVNFHSEFPFLRFSFGVETKSIALDHFDDVNIERLAGQHWFDAGDLVFTQDGSEKFRLDGVSRPDAFCVTCIKSQRSFVGVKKAMAREAAHA